MKAIFEGLWTVLKHAFRKRETLCYPEDKKDYADTFRGSVAFNSEKCTGCNLCKRFCPSIGTITIEDRKIKSVNLALCANCGLCAYNCPTKAIYMTKRYELATEDKNDLLLMSEK